MSSNLSSLPVPISVTDANLKTVANGGGVGKSDGTDIVFTASDGTTKLDHEIESYNASTGLFISWVRIPALSPTAETCNLRLLRRRFSLLGLFRIFWPTQKLEAF